MPLDYFLMILDCSVISLWPNRLRQLILEQFCSCTSYEKVVEIKLYTSISSVVHAVSYLLSTHCINSRVVMLSSHNHGGSF